MLHGADVKLVVSFRGTESLENWIENLRIAKTDREMSCAGCKVHSGFLDSFNTVADGVLAAIQEQHERYPGAPVYTTGHSLGGALAVIAAYVLEYDLHVPVSGVFTYGAPRVGNSAFAKFFNGASDTHVTYRLTHHRDPVPHLPMKVLGFRHTATEVFYRGDTHDHQVCDASGEDPFCSNHYLIDYSIHDHLSYFGESIGSHGC